MSNRAINRRGAGFLHGADYNPDQWQHDPALLSEDLRLMQRAHCNTVSLGIFAWSKLEPQEGKYTFDWLDRVMDDLWAAGIQVILATPSSAFPPWLSAAYPEVLRVMPDRRRRLHGFRQNHCYTSPVFREKMAAINRRLAERYRNHPALLLWHASNEYGGECHCELCQEAFRRWLKERYKDDLERLNRAWWTSFWSHVFTSWEQIESPAPHGESYLHGLTLDWRRFVTARTVDFYLAECVPLREITPSVPVTTNMMGFYSGIDYWKLAPHLDIASWDSYPCWHGTGRSDGMPRSGAGLQAGTVAAHGGQSDWEAEGRDWMVAAETAFSHDLARTLRHGQPFLLLESTTTFSNWHPIHKLKRPGMHLLSSLLAVAHGADSVQYFQWRKSRGGFEKFHGAVVDHEGSERTRVFAEVAETGRVLEALGEVAGSTVQAEAAVVFDWENAWAVEDAAGLRGVGEKGYLSICREHYLPLRKLGVSVDVIDADQDFTPYRLLAAPMLYLLRPGVAERLEGFVHGGGTLVATFWSGIVNESDLCFLGGFPGPLRRLLGVWSEEIDSLYPGERNRIRVTDEELLGFGGEYEARDYCDLIHPETAAPAAEYQCDFYRGRPAVTVNRMGRGTAYYLAARTEGRFLLDLYRELARRLRIRRALSAPLPPGLLVQERTHGERRYLFVLNFNPGKSVVDLGASPYFDLLAARPREGEVELEPFGFLVLKSLAGSAGTRFHPTFGDGSRECRSPV